MSTSAIIRSVAIPSTIGRLHVGRQLGAGGFATVWSARDPDLDAPVAVKILADNWAGQADVRQRFLDEARLLRRVDSDHLVRVYDVGQLPNERPYFVMTYADGGSLADRLVRLPPPWPADAVLAVVDAVAAGLTVLHTHGVVHRDVKPRNVLLRTARSGGEHIMLGDLGIAKDLDWASGLTMPAGSGGYMAPEQQAFSDRIGPPADVFALAMTTAELLHLRRPWPATPIGGVLGAATAADPDRRTATPGEFAGQLRAALEVTSPVEPVTVTQSSSGPPRTGPGRRRPAWLVGGGLLVVALAAWGWVAVTRPEAGAGLGACAGRSTSGSTRTLIPRTPEVSIQVPASWQGQAALGFPGETFTDEGVRAGDGTRFISVALNDFYKEPATVLSKIAVAGCGAPTQRTIGVGPYQGLGYHYTGCADGTVVDEVALAGNGSGKDEWSVWVEVRSVKGDPDLATVLASLKIHPPQS
jgi:eukaryotic-like serine/threonine-protein kinase